MIYNGQMDIIIGWPLTESFVTSLKWKGAKEYLGWRTCPTMCTSCFSFGCRPSSRNLSQALVLLLMVPKWGLSVRNQEARRSQWHVAGELAGYAKQVGMYK